MEKNDFLNRMADELEKHNISDATDIINEYEQHFAFKLADGFSEEEIIAKLEDPALLAMQFGDSEVTRKGGGKKFITIIGLVFADMFIAMLYVLLIAWGVVMATFAIVCVVTAICLIGRLNIHGLIPAMPYVSAVILGVALAVLAVLITGSCIYFWAFVRQFMRAYARFHRNTIVSAFGGAVLPPLAVHPQPSATVRRKFRSVTQIAFVTFVVFLMLGIIISMISAGAFGFWHTWGWFINVGGILGG